MYCELTLPARDMSLPVSSAPVMRKGEALVSGVFYPGTELAQGVHQYADGALLHPLRTGDDAGARSDTEVGGEKSHGGSGGEDIYQFGIPVKGTYHHLCVIAVAQIAGQDVAVGKGVEDEGAVADAFGCRKLYGCV